MPMSTVAEDFAYFADEVPGFYFFVGSTAKGVDWRNRAVQSLAEVPPRRSGAARSGSMRC
jgi:metal-dependent amidase/aminoacylase/carboxypeptidase family protein